ncbi:hypothetical protein ACSSS7_006728 [Eimeria intestinalis]
MLHRGGDKGDRDSNGCCWTTGEERGREEASWGPTAVLALRLPAERGCRDRRQSLFCLFRASAFLRHIEGSGAASRHEVYVNPALLQLGGGALRGGPPTWARRAPLSLSQMPWRVSRRRPQEDGAS